VHADTRAYQFSISFPTRRPPPSTLFPYTTLFRSRRAELVAMASSWHNLAVEAERSAHAPLPGEVVTPDQPDAQAERWRYRRGSRSEEHTSELQSQSNLVCRLLLEKKNLQTVTTAT